MPKAVKLTDKLVTSLLPEQATFDVWDTEIKGFTIRVSPTGNKSFRLVYRLNGTRKAFTIGKFGTLSTMQAREIAKQKAGAVANGVDVQAVKLAARDENTPKDDALTFREFVESTYSDWRTANKKDSLQSLNRIKACFYQTFGDLKLKDITAYSIEQWRINRQKSGLAHSTINRDLNELRALFSKAVEWRVLEESPVTSIKNTQADKLKRIRYLDKEESMRLRAALTNRDALLSQQRSNYNEWLVYRNAPPLPEIQHYYDHLTPMVLLSLNTGIRQGELFALDWRQVDLAQKILTIEGSTAKAGQTRHIPLNKEAMTVLKNWQEQTGANNGLVFKSDNGDKFTNVQTSWEKLRDVAKLEDFRWHDLRHTFASLLVMAGVDLNTVRELLGHSDIKMTLRYAHLGHEHKAKAVAALDI